MKRRIVLAACLIGVIGGGAGAALAATSVSTSQVCVVTSPDTNHAHNYYYCINLPTAH